MSRIPNYKSLLYSGVPVQQYTKVCTISGIYGHLCITFSQALKCLYINKNWVISVSTQRKLGQIGAIIVFS